MSWSISALASSHSFHAYSNSIRYLILELFPSTSEKLKMSDVCPSKSEGCFEKMLVMIVILNFSCIGSIQYDAKWIKRA